MAINEWWSEDPDERFWLEITDREQLGSNLYAPQTDNSGHETWSYTLVSHVRPGDIVFHYWKQQGQDKAIVGYSQATGALGVTTIRWQAHTAGASAGPLGERPAWLFPLAGFTDLASPVSLDDLRQLEPVLRREARALEAATPGPWYLPFVFSDKRPLRTAQAYLTKFPASFVAAIPGLDAALALPPVVGAGEVGAPKRTRARSTGHQDDPAVRKALERHAMDWTLQHFADLGYLVEDVSATNPFDVLAVSDDEELHIEVKGSSGTSTTIEVTEGEVQDALIEAEYFPVLVVVDQVTWTRASGGSITTVGGRPRIWWDWPVEPDDRLSPTSYRYLLPPAEERA